MLSHNLQSDHQNDTLFIKNTKLLTYIHTAIADITIPRLIKLIPMDDNFTQILLGVILILITYMLIGYWRVSLLEY